MFRDRSILIPFVYFHRTQLMSTTRQAS